MSDINKPLSSPFEYVNPVIPPIFAGRSKEVNIISKALFSEKESIVIYGDDAIGKSSIVSTIYLNQVKNSTSGIFAVRINAFDFIQAVENNFLGVTIHQICAAIWTSLLGRRYSDLFEDTAFNKSEIISTEEEVTIRKIVRIVTSEKNTATGKSNFELGGKFIIEGKATRANEFVNERKPLAHFEFLLLLDELTDIVRTHGLSSIMVFCDELNHFPEKTNTDILRDYFNIFHSQKIQFVLVILSPEITSVNFGKDLIDSFNFKLAIGRYKHIDDAIELIDNAINSINADLVFERPAIEFLFEKTNGHPWWIQKICDLTFKSSIIKNIHRIDLNALELAYKEFANEIKYYEEQVKEGKPFRKHFLLNIR